MLVRLANELRVRPGTWIFFLKNAHLKITPALFPRRLIIYTPFLNTLLSVSPSRLLKKERKKAVRENKCRSDYEAYAATLMLTVMQA